MKYLIKESQIKNLMWEYFDSYDYEVKETNHYTYLKNDKGVVDWAYTYDDNRLAVSTNIILGFAAMFNVSDDDALEYAGEWFEINYDCPVGEIINY
jgi:hypothetical protein